VIAVVWDEAALDELADIWVRITPAARARVEAAHGEVNRRLQTDPANEGESRSEGRRVTIVLPLAVVFRYDPDLGIVDVLHVSLFERQR
jgi:hypothetical protein